MGRNGINVGTKAGLNIDIIKIAVAGAKIEAGGLHKVSGINQCQGQGWARVKAKIKVGIATMARAE